MLEIVTLIRTGQIGACCEWRFAHGEIWTNHFARWLTTFLQWSLKHNHQLLKLPIYLKLKVIGYHEAYRALDSTSVQHHGASIAIVL